MKPPLQAGMRSTKHNRSQAALLEFPKLINYKLMKYGNVMSTFNPIPEAVSPVRDHSNAWIYNPRSCSVDVSKRKQDAS